MAASLRQMKTQLRARAGNWRTSRRYSDVYYPASNRLAADVALNAGRRGWRGLDKAIVTVVRNEPVRQNGRPRPISGASPARSSCGNTKRWRAGKLARAYPQLDKAYQDLHKRVAATRMWASVYDTACLVLPSYAGRVTGGREKSAAEALLARLRGFAHPEEASTHAD